MIFSPVGGTRSKARKWYLLLGVALTAALAAFLFWAAGGETLLRRDRTWAQMIATKDFRVGLDPSFPPFEHLNGAGVPEGYDVELAQALAKRWGIEPKIITIGFDSLLDAVRAARVDAVISAMPYDERLTRDVVFSPPYFESGIRLVVPRGSPIAGTEQLAGARLAVEWGSAGDMIARTLQRNEFADMEIVQYDTPQAALDALLSESPSADALLIDQVSLRLAQGSGAPLVAVGPVLETNPYVIVSPRAAHQLAQEIADALAAFAQDGTLDRLEDRWFGEIVEPSP